MTGHGKTKKIGELYPGDNYTRIVHNLLPLATGYNTLDPSVPAENISMMSVFDGDGNLLAGPHFVPMLEIQIDYDWGNSGRNGKTVKNFVISGDEPERPPRYDRVGFPITLGTVPVMPLRPIEAASPEIS